MNKNIAIGIIAVIVLVGGGIYIASNKGASQDSAAAPTTSAPHESINPNAGGDVASSTSGSGAAAGATYTLAQVQAHSSRSSCWTAINGGVYDVTSWIDRHPGGAQAILSTCGKDASDAFNGQHGGQRRPEQELATFRIGALAQ